MRTQNVWRQGTLGVCEEKAKMLFVPAGEVVLHQCTCQQSVPEMEVGDSSGKDDCNRIRSLQTVGIGKEAQAKIRISDNI
jgi:hypothetical protein